MPPPVNRRPVQVVPTAGRSGPQGHTVAAGESLSAIARKYGTTTQALVDANKLKYPSLSANPNSLKKGWQLNLPGAGEAAPTSNDRILMVGMGKDSVHEANELKKKGADVTFIGDSFENDKLKGTDASGKAVVFDLATDEGLSRFGVSLGLPSDQTGKVVDALKAVGPDARDELGGLAREWAKAEKGGGIPSRFMLSGHHVGSGVWGDDNGKISWDALSRLTQAMPRAARAVEDLHISACYSGGLPAMERYRAMFPNAKTIWAYTGSAPGSWSGAMTHQGRWETATRGSRADLDRAIAENSRKGENVAVWSRGHGYLNGQPPSPLADVRRSYESTAGAFERGFSGQEPVENPQAGPLRDHYNALQRLLQHPELPAAERKDLETRRDQTIRLIYYSATVAPRFAQFHKGAIDAGFSALGMNVPDFSKLGRADAMKQVADFEAAISAAKPVPGAGRTLLPLLAEGLRGLEPSRIPDTWV